MSVFPSWIGWLLAATVLPSAVIAALTLYPVRAAAWRLGLMAQPSGHSTHTRVTPLGGGLGIWAGVIVTFAIGSGIVVAIDDPRQLAETLSRWNLSPPDDLLDYWSGLRTKLATLWWLLIAGTAMTVLGYIDDRRGMSPWMRLAVEFAVGAAVIFGLGFRLTAFIEAVWLTDVLSVIWIVAVINSFNMLDNMDGLSGGVAAIIAAAMAAVMLVTPDPGSARPQLFVAALLLVTAGAILGFLWHNRPPAKIFMGDAGSYLVGFLIAVSMLMATYAGGGGASPRPHAVLAPLCAMAVPLYDMITVLWIRARQGRSLFVGDRSHFSHRLVELGLGRTQAVLTIHLLTATCGLAAVLLTQVSIGLASIVVGIVGCVLLLIAILESTQWRNENR